MMVAAVVPELDDAEIAARLSVSPFTVEIHADRAMTEVGARDGASGCRW
jgi:DNA-binding NarL/FixJ family response regulator